MGSLKPGARYVYERQGDTVYAREFGSEPSTRKAIGWDYNPGYNLARVTGVDQNTGNKDLADHKEWVEIRLAGKKNPALQKAIENVKIIYKMVKDDK
jgi:hypothetical protein